jgi:hypothetical protein
VSQFSSSCVVLFGAAALLASAGAARATCPIDNAGYQGGAYGAYAVTTTGCFTDIVEDGGTGFTTATAAGVGLSSSADLATGVLTADSESGFASSFLWDSFTYTGLPAGGATIMATLSLPGTVNASSDSFAVIEEGSQTDLNNMYSVFFNDTTEDAKPPSIPLSFSVTNGVTVVVFAEIEANGTGQGGVVNLGDPPMLSLTLPRGASVTTASGVFDNFTSAPVPEPSTWAMLLIGFAGIGVTVWRARRTAAA